MMQGNIILRLTAVCLVLCTLEFPASGNSFKNDRSAPNSKIDVVFMVHTSKKSGNDKISLKNFMKSIIGAADVDSGNAQFSVVDFHKKGKVIFSLNQFNTKAALLKAVDESTLKSTRRSSLIKGLATIRSKVFKPKFGERSKAEKVIIIVTDDVTSKDKSKKVRKMSRFLTARKVKVVAITIGTSEHPQLAVYAGSSGASMKVDSFDKLMEAKPTLIQLIPASKPFGEEVVYVVVISMHITSHFRLSRNVHCDV